MSGSCREALPDVRELLRGSLDVREWSAGPPGDREWLGGLSVCPGVVGRPCRKSGSGRKASQMSGSGRKALPDVREWAGGPPV